MKMRLFKDKKGHSLTEFAITIPVMVTMIYGLIAINDLTIARIKAEDIARYAAFAWANANFSDFSRIGEIVDGGSSSTYARYNTFTDVGMKGYVKRLWRDLNPNTYGISTSTIDKKVGGSSMRVEVDDFVNDDSPAISGNLWKFVTDAITGRSELPADNGELNKQKNSLGGLDDAYNFVIRRAGFDARGWITSNIKVKSRNIFLPTKEDGTSRHLPFNFIPESWYDEIEIPVSLSILTNSWRLENGDYSDLRSYNDAYHNEIRHMWMGSFDPGVAVGNWIGNKVSDSSNGNTQSKDELSWKDSGGAAVSEIVSTAIDVALSFIPGQPFAVRLASRPYGKQNSWGAAADWESGMIDVYDENNANKEKRATVTKFHTIPMVTDGEYPQNNEYYRTFQKRGPYFMGCTTEQNVGCKSSSSRR